jgi:hypothetical protein
LRFHTVNALVFTRRKALITAAKIAVSGLLLFWVLSTSNLGQVRDAMRSANIALLVLAFALNFGGATYLRAVRWQALMRTWGISVSVPFLIRSYMVSFFFSNFLPSTIGGDASRMYDTWRAGDSKSGAIATVFVDRFLGIFALMLLAVAVIPMATALTSDIPLLPVWVAGGTIALAVPVWWIFMGLPHIRFIITAKRRLPSKLSGALDTVVEAFVPFRGKKRVLAWSMFLSLALQATIITHYYLIAKALGLSVPYQDFFLIVPLATVIMMVPISINAIGVREGVLVFFLATYGVDASAALALSWLAFGIVIVTGGIGGVVYALRREESPASAQTLSDNPRPA